MPSKNKSSTQVEHGMDYTGIQNRGGLCLCGSRRPCEREHKYKTDTLVLDTKDTRKPALQK